MANTSMACRATTQMVVALEVKSEGKIGLDKPYLLCYRITCIEARRTAGPFLPTQADSIPRIRIQFWCLVGAGCRARLHRAGLLVTATFPVGSAPNIAPPAIAASNKVSGSIGCLYRRDVCVM